MLPEPEARFRVPPDTVKLPPRVIVPVVPAVRFIVPLADESPVITILPAAPVVSVKLPTDDAPKFTESVSVINPEPVVETVRVPAVVRISEPAAPMFPPPVELSDTNAEVSVPAVRIIAPAADKVNEVAGL